MRYGSAADLLSLAKKNCLQRVREQLSKFYAVLSANERVLRFVFVTGIIRFNEVCLSSEFGFTDLSLDPRYGSLVGFTRGEVEGYFEDFIEKSAKELSISRDDLIEDARRDNMASIVLKQQEVRKSSSPSFGKLYKLCTLLLDWLLR